MAASKKKPWLDVRALVQALAAFAICGLLAWCGTSIKTTLVEVKSTIDKHSTAVESIPTIKDQVTKVEAKVDTVNLTIPKLVTWEQLNTKLSPQEKKLDDIAKEQQDQKVQLAKDEAVRDALKNTTGPNPK